MPGLRKWAWKADCECIYDYDPDTRVLGPDWKVAPELKYGDKKVQVDMGKIQEMYDDSWVNTERDWCQDVCDYIQGLISQIKPDTRHN